MPPAVAGICSNVKVRVAIDVGHTAANSGATSASGKTEHSFNQRFALELVEDSRAFPALEFFMLEPPDDGASLRERPQQAAKTGADIILSIHHDAVNDKYMRDGMEGGVARRYSDAFRGYSLFVSSGNSQFSESLRMARAIGHNLKSLGFLQSLHHAEPIQGENRKLLDWEYGVYDAPFSVLKASRIPAILIEVGVIVHRAEEQDLNTREYRRKFARAVLRAFETCG